MLTSQKQQRRNPGHVRRGLPLPQSATRIVNELHFCAKTLLPIAYFYENPLSAVKYAIEIKLF